MGNSKHSHHHDHHHHDDDEYQKELKSRSKPLLTGMGVSYYEDSNWSPIISEAVHPFEENGFVIVKNFVDLPKAKYLGLTFKSHCRDNNVLSDSQVKYASAVYNYSNFVDLLFYKTAMISDLLGKSVRPYYSYARLYDKGSCLKKHTDRQDCEIAVTINLGGENNWEFNLLSRIKEKVSIPLSLGDAVIYKGNQTEHWRDLYNGSWYSEVSLYYVNSNGRYKDIYLDPSKEKQKSILSSSPIS